MTYARRVDGNQADIFEAFRRLGCTVMDLSRAGGGVPDALISPGVLSLPIEIKNPNGKNKISDAQSRVFSEYTGTIRMIRSVDDVLETVRLATKWRNLILKAEQ